MALRRSKALAMSLKFGGHAKTGGSGNAWSSPFVPEWGFFVAMSFVFFGSSYLAPYLYRHSTSESYKAHRPQYIAPSPQDNRPSISYETGSATTKLETEEKAAKKPWFFTRMINSVRERVNY